MTIVLQYLAHAGAQDGQHAGALLHGPQAGAQPQVLHMGGAAGPGREGPERAVVRHGEHLGRGPRPGTRDYSMA